MKLYDRILKIVINKISMFGRTVIWRKVIYVDNALEPWKKTSGLNVDVYVKMLFTTKYKEQSFIYYLTGKEIKSGSVYGLFITNTFEPELKDFIIDGLNKYKPISINLIKPGDTTLLYVIELER